MPERKNGKAKNKLTLRPLFLLLIVIFIGWLVPHLFLSTQIKSVFENPKTEVKKLPPELKEKIANRNASETFRVPILFYHYVEYVADKKDTTRQSLDISPFTFEQQVKTLKDAGYTFMTAGELSDVLDGKGKLPTKPILLTFDDGHWDMDTDVLPILKKYNAKATAYLITNFLGGSDFLSDDQVKDLISSGLVEIGSHTVHHVALKNKLPPVVDFEVSQSKKLLEQTFNIKVVSFAYPDGSFDEQAIEAIKKAGYKSAVSTIPGVAQSVENRFFLFRLRPGYRTGNELLKYLNQSSFRAF